LLENEESDVTIEMNSNHFRMSTAQITFTTKLIDGRFPDYEAVMAPKLDKTIIVSRHGLLDVLSRAAIMTNEKFRGVRLGVEKDRLEVSANNPEQEEANDEIPIVYEGDSVEIGFNVNYLMDALKALPGEDIELKLQDANSSCTMSGIDEKDTLYLVMPMRL
jgi:DNA polymerase-3 subunit beta